MPQSPSIITWSPSPHVLTLRTCAVPPLHSLTWTTTTPATRRQDDWHIIPRKSGKQSQKLPSGLLLYPLPSAVMINSNYTQRLIYGDWSLGLKICDSQTSGQILSDDYTARKISEATEYKLHFLARGYSTNHCILAEASIIPQEESCVAPGIHPPARRAGTARGHKGPHCKETTLGLESLSLGWSLSPARTSSLSEGR